MINIRSQHTFTQQAPGEGVPSSYDALHRIRVAVVDDHPAICEALSSLIRREPDMTFCGEACTAAACLEVVAECKPDVVVLDLLLGDAYGLSLIGEIRRIHAETQIVIYSMSNESVFAERALRAGALGIVSKNESTSVVLEAIRAVYCGRAFVGRELALRLLGLRLKGGQEHARTGFDALTDQEMTVVQLLHMGHTVEGIANILRVSHKTVQAYHRRARTKLGCATTGQLLQSMLGATHG